MSVTNTRASDPDLDREINEFPILPFRNIVFIKVVENEGQGSITFPKGSAMAREPCRGIVIAAGPGARIEGPAGVYTVPVPGDHIVHGRFSGATFTCVVRGRRREYPVMSEGDLLGEIDLEKEQMNARLDD